MALEDDVQRMVTEIQLLVKTLDSLGQSLASSTKNNNEVLIQAMARMTATLDKRNRTERQQTAATEQFARSVRSAAEAAKQEAQASEDVVQANQQQAKSTQNLTREQEANQRALNEYRAALDKNRNFVSLAAREKLAEARANKTLTHMLEKRAGDDVEAHMRLQQQLAAMGMLTDFTKQVASTFKNFSIDLAKGNTSFTMLNSVVDGLAGAVGKVLGSIPLIGGFLKGVTEGAAEGFKILIDQLETASQTFNQLAQAGALTERGMTGVQQQFLESGLSLDAYRQIVTSNAAALARFGGTVGKGAQQFTALLGSIVDSEAGDQLRRIGFSADQIGESTAAFIAQQTRLGLSQNRSQAQLRQGSIEYAQELDRLAKLTGMQRKEIQAQQDAVLSEARFRAEYDDMVARGQEGQAKAMMDFQTMVNTASPEIGQGLRDMAAGFVNSDAAIKLFTTTGGAAADIMAQVKSGQIDQVTAFRMLQDATRQQMGVSRELAKAVGNETNRFVDYAQQSDFVNAKLIDGQVQLVRQQQEQMKKGTDPLTDSTVEAQKNLQQMSRQLSNFALELLPMAGTAVAGFTDIVNRSIQVIAKATGIELKNLGYQQQSVAPEPRDNYTQMADDMSSGVPSSTYNPAIEMLPRPQEQSPKKRMSLSAADQEKIRKSGLPPSLGLQDRYGNSQDAAKPNQDAFAPGSLPMPKMENVRPENLFDFRGGISGRQENFDNLQPAFKSRLMQMALEYRKLTGDRLPLNSGARTKEENAAVGGVGSSRHLDGLAVDLTAESVNRLKEMGLLDRYGFKQNPRSGWHISDDGFRMGGISRGPESGYHALLHGTEAVVPLPDGRAIPVKIEVPEIRNPFADMSEPAETPDLTTVVDRMSQQIRQAIQDAMRGGSNMAIESALQELVNLQRNNNSTAERLLQASVN